ncbi:hypothetical protein RD792_011525 [Penstemon davidsonii]|uniref:Protein kinase domain-containing protein n=1 Tax=Penstemon davidsonii TaxID=160366 RepID=A0ABR0D4U9_9LAMI|nr:hypothetical protein RD792_011525 [Penstemon davidsonii]
MAAESIFYLLFTLIIYLLTVAGASSDELETLLSIKNAFQKDSNTKVFDSWEPNNNIPICNFSRITCDSNGLVKEIELSNQNLTGLLPPLSSICNNLKSLEKLSLGFNQLYGPLEFNIINCSSLKYLDLGNNFFSGSKFPYIYSPLLTTLYANNSGFSGTFPWDSLQNMTSLQVLSLGDNPFERTPFPQVIPKYLTNLKWLYLSNCSIEGEIPEEIGNLVDLVDLELAQNYITGKIPSGIVKLHKLWQLELYDNELSGELPAGFGRNLTNLEYFDASTNYLRGNISEVRFLNKLKSLQLFHNQFSGEVPPEVGDFKNLVNLSLYQNQLSGQLPQKLGSWADFHFIDVSENMLTGPIPPNMCSKSTMVKLLMLQNNFTGEIPDTYANCTTLVRFRVSKNGLTGRVPSGIWGLPNAEIIDIADNNLEGNLTSDIVSAKSLAQLFLANNRLSGELPFDISKVSSLVSIDLSYNQFYGEIPGAIGELKQLTSLELQGNKFFGLIPDSLGYCNSINNINMGHNSFTGQIPASIGSLPTLNFLNLSSNQLSGQIPRTLSSLRLNLLDLSDNRLTGTIPESLLTEANNGSFAGNGGLCSEKVRGFRRCTSHRTPMVVMLFCLMVAASIAILLVSLCTCFLSKKKRKEKGEGSRSLKEDSWDIKSFHMLTFTEDEILDSIKEDNLIGKGGCGNVYRVVVGNNEKLELAVKHIWHYNKKLGSSSTPMLGGRSYNKNKSREFEAEVKTLSSIRHINVVKLYCSITSEDSSLLVYEYMPNGSLWDILHTYNKKLSLDWIRRYEIALGAARGLEYLHHGCDKPVIHRDVKSSNILLDEYLKPRIADFGLAKIVQPDSIKDSTQIIAGTHGYIAPEYGYTNKVNEKSDLYSFGVVLMELVTGQRPIEPEFGENKDIVEWVCSRLKSKESVVSMLDSAIHQVYREDAIKVLKVAILCTARLPNFRPTMRTVVQMLEEAQPCKLVSIIVSKDGGGM